VVTFVVTVLVPSAAILCGTTPTEEVRMGALLSVEEVATELGTPVRFVRRLVHERRIRFHKIGKYVRIAQADLEEFIVAGAVAPAAGSTSRRSR
jgi:excisionase family DNA binding protein